MAQPDYDEQHLIERAREGDVESFNALVLAYQDRIYTITYRIMGEPDGAADMTQDTFLTAYRKLDTYRGGSFYSWLGRIATNLCYDELRRLKRRPADYLEDMGPEDSDDPPPIAADMPTPEQTALSNELQQAIQDCITSLKEDQRTVIVLSDVQGFSYQEIAETMGANLGTVKSRLARARLAVRRCLQSVQELLPAEYRLFTD